MNQNQPSDVKNEDNAQLGTSTNTDQVPTQDTETIPSDQTIKPEDTGVEGTEDSGKPDSMNGEPPAQKGRAAQRIGELIRQNKSLQEQLAGKPDVSQTVIPDTTVTGETPEIKRAKEFLSSLGYTPKSEVDQTVKDQIQDFEARMILDQERNRLEGAYNGSDGRPKYDHEKIMKHAQDTGIYNPEAAYK